MSGYLTQTEKEVAKKIGVEYLYSQKVLFDEVENKSMIKYLKDSKVFKVEFKKGSKINYYIFTPKVKRIKLL